MTQTGIYTFLDRPVLSLNEGGRLLVWSMRAWVHSLHRHPCAPECLARVFARHGLIALLPPFHGMMRVLNRDASEDIGFAPMGCQRVAEGEALVLSLVGAAQVSSADTLRATLELMMMEGAVVPMIQALAAIGGTLANRGWLPAMAAGTA